jgi:hypothetical protein
MNVKTRFATSLFLLAAASLAMSKDMTVGMLIRHERLSPEDAASTYALSRALGVPQDFVLWAKRELNKPVWQLGPALNIAARQRTDPRYIWSLHQRGYSWVELERERIDDRYGRREEYPGRGRDGWNDYRDRIQGGGGIGDIAGEILGGDARSSRPDGRGYDGPYEDRRGGYGGRAGNRPYGDARYLDEQYETRFWTSALRRAFGIDVSRVYRYGQSNRDGDLAIAAHIAKLGRASIEDVLYEHSRFRNWNRTRAVFGITSDWDRFDTRQRYRGNYGRRDKNFWDLLDGLIR